MSSAPLKSFRYHVFWTPTCSETVIHYFGSHTTLGDAKVFLRSVMESKVELKELWSRESDDKLAAKEGNTNEIYDACERIDHIGKEYYAYSVPNKKTLDNLLTEEPKCLDCCHSRGFGLLWIISSDDKPRKIGDKLIGAGCMC